MYCTHTPKGKDKLTTPQCIKMDSSSSPPTHLDIILLEPAGLWEFSKWLPKGLGKTTVSRSQAAPLSRLPSAGPPEA